MRPLEGICILDLSRVLACPFASMILAELGAEVIKVEQPGAGDETRSFEPMVQGDGEAVSAYYLAFNRSKRSITVNLRSPAGQEVVRGLAAHADVVLDNFPVGTLKKYGLDYASLRARNDQLIHVSCTGFGMTGPYAHRKGYDTVFQAMAGIMSLTGERGGGPVKPGLPIADLSSGLWVAIAILTALVGRASSGQGSHVDFSMFDGQVGLLSLAAARWFALGEVPQRMGTEHPGRIPSAAFVCGDGKWVQITGSDQHWRPLCLLLGLEDWAEDPGLQKNAGRLARREEVMAGLQTAIASLSREELCRRCDVAGVPAGPILDVGEVLGNEHVAQREMVVEYEHPHIGSFRGMRVPLRFSGLDDPCVGRPPLLGEHTEAVLREKLSLSQTEIERLRAEGAV
ncbi:acyl-CoA transferase [Bordetella trematum]|uniref:Acyl-CoA transferase n=1 Tax=Bordetella trematum TaxID=123899 RepID=A0A157SJU3_9BORD|nr:CaiB/BaiF CoA-transferase family protein [Bordetella trematum]AZR93301.1 acyl-CoA transferase [Bordetella trematum]NNH20577.1 CoA transferase [Bordetella trematum]SAI20250.1 acyl-CoA transferase [Bordetella trematum]SAI70677.1 acyl-CoA transferase [Bordetella trematum]SUV98662.1 acyl-CoA transferase [Bordetella trematum]